MIASFRRTTPHQLEDGIESSDCKKQETGVMCSHVLSSLTSEHGPIRRAGVEKEERK